MKAAMRLPLLGLALGLACLALYAEALRGPFISDDVAYILSNPFVSAPGPGWLSEIFDPDGPARLHALGNYAPVQIALHAIEWQVFGEHTLGYHLVNLALHVANALLLVLLLEASGVSRRAATLAGAFFALHPANVEAVAWISQLKSVLALFFALLALLRFRERPLASALIFGLGLLSKASAALALPMLGALYWSWRARGETDAAQLRGLLLWCGVLVVFLPLQLATFTSVAGDYADPYPDALTMLRSVAGIGARYIALAVSGLGTSAFHEIEPVRTWSDPWWICGVLLAPLFVWRIVVTLRRRSEEAAWWIAAAAGFGPVSQLFPFFFPMADRWLYFILPGLIGGSLLAARDLAGELRLAAAPRRAVAIASGLACCALLTSFALGVRDRAELYVDETRMTRDAARNYPAGALGQYIAAVDALAAGDSDRALVHLRASADQGGHFLHAFYGDPYLVALRGDPRFQQLLREIARKEIDYTLSRGLDTQQQLLGLAGAHFYLGELDAAIAAAERGLRQGGPLQSELSQMVFGLRAERARRRRDGSQPEPPM